MGKKLKMGMLGGGNNAFIGAIHRCAAFMDNKIELSCGCFSRHREISLSSGREYHLPENRIYENYEDMILGESHLPEEVRMDFLSIVTPNVAHYAPARMAMEHGFDVVLEKPVCFSLDEAKELKDVMQKTGRIIALTHTYSGYPAVKEARYRIHKGEIGEIRKIYVEYPQGWLFQRAEDDPKSNAGWRTDPARSGKAGCMGDIGTHAMHLAEYISGLRCTSMCSDLNIFVKGRRLDDDGAALLKFGNGASGVLMASQIAVGEENALKIRIYGEKGAFEWRQQEPNTLIYKHPDNRIELLRVGNAYFSDIAKYNTRTPGGHPEGYIEAFANIYKTFAKCVTDRKENKNWKREDYDFPGIDDGIRGMQFIETIVESSRQQAWIDWIE